MAVVLVLVFCTALMVLGSALVSYAVNEKLITAYNSRNISLYYLAEAGVEAAIAVLQEDSSYTGTVTGHLNSGTYQARVTLLDQQEVAIQSVATLEGYEKYLTVILVFGEEGKLKVKDWRKPSAVKPSGLQ